MGAGHQQLRELAYLAGLPARPVRPRREDRRLGVRQPGCARGPGARVRRTMVVRPVGRARAGGGAAAGASRRPDVTGAAGPSGPEDPAGEGKATLAVIDMQRVFGDRDSPWFTPRFALIDAYRPHVV